MKTLKLTTLFVTLASAFLFSSCLSNDSNAKYPYYQSYVTITGDAAFGYTFHSDFGCTLKPTSSSVETVLPGLSKSNVKRALVAFDLIPENLNGTQLEAGKTYDIALVNYHASNYSLPTYKTIDTHNDQAAADTLVNKKSEITSVDDKNIWAINGYINIPLTLTCEYGKPFFLNCYYDSTKDIDLSTNTLYLNLYYNANAEYPSYTGSTLSCFELPEELYGTFTDSVNIVVKALVDDKTELSEVGKCKVALKDFLTPRY